MIYRFTHRNIEIELLRDDHNNGRHPHVLNFRNQGDIDALPFMQSQNFEKLKDKFWEMVRTAQDERIQFCNLKDKQFKLSL